MAGVGAMDVSSSEFIRANSAFERAFGSVKKVLPQNDPEVRFYLVCCPGI